MNSSRDDKVLSYLFIILVQFIGSYILDVEISTTRQSQQHILDNTSMIGTEVESGNEKPLFFIFTHLWPQLGRIVMLKGWEIRIKVNYF